MEPLRSLAFGGLSGAYAPIGTALVNPCRLYNIQNFTNVTLMISLDGINNHFRIPSQGYRDTDVAANQSLSQGWYVPAGTIFYAKTDGAPATSGSIDVDVAYGI